MSLCYFNSLKFFYVLCYTCTKVFKQKAKEEAWFCFVAFSFKIGLKMWIMQAYSRESLVADFFILVLFLNLIERMNYGKYNIFIYSLMKFFSFQTVLDQTTDLKVMSVLDRKVTHLFCIHL